MSDESTASETKLCKCSGAKRWYPNSVSRLDSFLSPFIKKTAGVPNGYAIRKNLCYGLQHLEYLTASLSQLSLSDVLITMTYKQFVVSGIGIIEGVLYYFVRERQLLRTNEWELVTESSSQPSDIDVVTVRVDTRILRKRPDPIEEEPTFERILRTAEKKKVLGANAAFYAQAHHLRKLRNKVHLYVTANDLDSDWNAFGFKEFELMKAALLALFTGQPFSPTVDERRYFAFLEPSKSLGVAR